MAHIQQFQFFEVLSKLYPQHFLNGRVAEIGSLDINGSIKQFFKSSEYTGYTFSWEKGLIEQSRVNWYHHLLGIMMPLLVRSASSIIRIGLKLFLICLELQNPVEPLCSLVRALEDKSTELREQVRPILLLHLPLVGIIIKILMLMILSKPSTWLVGLMAFILFFAPKLTTYIFMGFAVTKKITLIPKTL